MDTLSCMQQKDAQQNLRRYRGYRRYGCENKDVSHGTGKERRMRVTEKLVNSQEEEVVTLEYIRFTKDYVAERYRACSSGNCNVCCDLSYYG